MSLVSIKNLCPTMREPQGVQRRGANGPGATARRSTGPSLIRAVARIRRLIQMRIRRLAARARADRELAHRHETVAAILVITLFWVAMFGAAIIGADRQDAALAAEHQALEAERIADGHAMRSHWGEFPNASRCGWNCIGRIPTQGETWDWPTTTD